jgi:hypothetical protein
VDKVKSSESEIEKRRTEAEALWIPRWGSENPLFENSMLNREKVKFRDGSHVIVYEENQMMADYITALEEAAENYPHPDIPRQLFRKWYYSKLIACSVGDVPTDEQARAMPSIELNKWIDAVRKVNPNWFINLDNSIARLDAEEKKRKPKRPRR